MSTKITSSSSSYHFSSHGKGCKNQNTTKSQPYNVLPTTKRAKKMDQTQNFLKFSAKYGISTPSYKAVSLQGNIRVKASSSPNNPSSSWQKWLLGILLTVILPAVGYKGGLFLNLKSKIDKTIETVEHVTEVVEKVAEEAEKIVEEVEEKLPGDSKLKETLESFDDLAKKAVNEAKKAEDVAHKVKEVEEEIEETLIKAGKDQADN
ncbi:hypothetical protein Pfo_007859 [Paulownia fortunei]|nr:hypothetical protein Pfo_007859 [Paulownia fortunei]